MSRTRALIDTNVLIALEDPGRTDPLAADFARRCQKGGITIYIHPATKDDFDRDRNHLRRTISTSRMEKFPCLSSIPLPARTTLEGRYGPIRSQNDQVDVALLHALSIDTVDVLVSQDAGLHQRVRATELEERVLTLADAVSWLRALQDPVDDGLPLVEDVPAYSLDSSDPIFDSLKADYVGFASWWQTNCIGEHRDCWIVEGENGSIAGLVVRKKEMGVELGLDQNQRLLKLCTFKVASQSQGHKVGELLLRKALWHAQLNGFDLIYLTAFPKQTMLIGLLARYGFHVKGENAAGELILTKTISREMLKPLEGTHLGELARTEYPRFCLQKPAMLYAVPVQWRYHRQLFPEAAQLTPLPLFDDRTLDDRDALRIAGNTIRKVYVCRAQIGRLKSGDVLFFYQSKDRSAINSQSITTVGVVEQARRAYDDRELSRFTAGRSVFSEEDLKALADASPKGVTVIDFLLIRHLQPTVSLDRLIQTGVLSGPPQTITSIPRSALPSLVPSMKFGFEL
jgi:ribosomal protein S18 acetylase RimI-like enzyme